MLREVIRLVHRECFRIMVSVIGHAALISVPRMFHPRAGRPASAGGGCPSTFLGPFSRPQLHSSVGYFTTASRAENNVTRSSSGEKGYNSVHKETYLEDQFTGPEGESENRSRSGFDGGGAVWSRAGDMVESDLGFGPERLDSSVPPAPNSFGFYRFESRVRECDLSGEGCIIGENEVEESSGRTVSFGSPSAEVRERRVAAAWEHWRKLGAPALHLAPMVDQSELPYRMLCRKYGAKAAYTPMLHSRVFVEDRNYRMEEFSTCEVDRPLLVQFCGNDPETLLQAALQVQSQCDYVDINLGCPQRVARRGNYGAFLMDDLPLVHSLVFRLASNLSVPVSCKIRIFPELEDTIAYAQMLEAAGCSLLAVHGRTREQKFNELARADWNAIRAVKEAVRIPVLANGNIRWLEDVEVCMAATGVDGVMSAESLLENPALFAGYRTVMDRDPMNPSLKIIDERVLCLEYIDLVEKYPVPMRMVLRHVFRLLTNYWFQLHADLRDELHNGQYKLSMEFLRDLMQRLIARGPPLYSPYNGQEFPDARPPPAELPVVGSEAPPVAALYIPDSVERNRLMRMIRRRPSKKIKLPSDWMCEQTNKLQGVEA